MVHASLSCEEVAFKQINTFVNHNGTSCRQHFFLKPGSHEIFSAIRVVQKDLKDKGLKLSEFVFCVFLLDLNDLNDQVLTRLNHFRVP